LSIALRQCVVCKQMKEKPRLLRLKREKKTREISWSAENSGGFGIYLCPQSNCLKDFLFLKKFKKRYRRDLTPACRERLTGYLSQLAET